MFRQDPNRVSIPTRGNTLFRVHLRHGGCRRARRFQSPRGETPCSGRHRPRASRGGGLPFQSPLGETPCSGGENRAWGSSCAQCFNPHSGKHPVPGKECKGISGPRGHALTARVKGGKVLFQSPLGETPCSGTLTQSLRARLNRSFQSPLGETPCSGTAFPLNRPIVLSVFQSPLGETPCSGRAMRKLASK